MDTDNTQSKVLLMLEDPSMRNEGFRLLMKQHGKKLYWHIRRIVVGHEDAEDVLQDTFVRIHGGLGSYRGEGDISAWLYRIATNEALRHLRRQTHLFQSIDSLGKVLSEKLEADVPMEAEAIEVLFQKALLTLPTQQRIAFNLRYYDELSYDEIASITGKSVGSLKTNYHYATERIKKYIQEHTS